MHKIITNHAHIKSTVCIDFEFDAGKGKRTKKHVDISEGDKITIQYFEPRMGQVLTCKAARVSKIIHVPTRANEEDISLQIDASVDMMSKTFIIPTKNILDVSLLCEGDHLPCIPTVPEVDPDEGPHDPQSISWTLDPISIDRTDGVLLKIPYARNEAGTIFITVADTAGNVYFKEKFVADSANLDASFTWSLRTFEDVAKKLKDSGADPVLVDKDGFFVYQNGDNQNPIIAATDRDNSLIIPAGTVLVFTIAHTFSEDVTDEVTKITREYVVKKTDVEAVTV